ncbi:uncharacterized protein LAESUDRAFT_558896 [Laetiporus sulphureus 93-53]|uniref:Uncharacterized protein n=1 Tax=Laetiporus sulphureus 93-53 TaxID=1314785 RepID=A0A165B5M4_9APHY|nr:uncharacterized protein LAESUDRAFT_558896 [Laetiporus sulphureus 93-53]KZT00291.1 hypothetical protein LAESUDRAFT_558896 [Laetiporus sulphureus 93-53]
MPVRKCISDTVIALMNFAFVHVYNQYGDLNATDPMFVGHICTCSSYPMVRTSLSHNAECGRCPRVKNGNMHASRTHSKPVDFAAK